MRDPTDNPLDSTERDPTEIDPPIGGDDPKPAETIANSAAPPTEPAGADPSLDDELDTTEANPEGDGDDATVVHRSNRSDPAARTRIRYLGDYELIDVIGRGGMGVVFRARQISLNRTVALKLIRSEGLPSDSELRRFLNEAEAVASLDHPGIVPIHEIGTHEGRHYFSMKLIEGQSLQQAAPRLRRNFKAIARILAAAAEAVHHAHERGILHRDLKPANILLDAEDAPHISDFGLAKRIDLESADLTQTGAVVGTPAYMAPEQATASRGMITTSTDVYGLGAVLYSLLAGRSPHRGSSMLEILDAIREYPPAPPSKIDATVPVDLEVVCMKCLEKDPRRRYRSARELGEDLVCWLEGRPISARPVGPLARVGKWCRRKPLAAGLAAALFGSMLVGSAGVLVNWLEVRRQRDQLARANREIRAEWENSRLVNEFLIYDLLAWSSPFVANRRDVPVSTLLDRSAALAQTRFVSRPRIEGVIRQALGHAYLALGMLSKAEAELLHGSRSRPALLAQGRPIITVA